MGGATGINRELSDHFYSGNWSGDLLLCTELVTHEVKFDCLVLGTVHQSCCVKVFGG